MFAFGVLAYGSFLAAFAWTVLFVGGVGPLPTVDGPAGAGASSGGGVGPGGVGGAVVVDLALLLLFGLQHSVMARRPFKQRWTRFVPRPVERSVYVLVTSLVLALIYSLWQPIDATIFAVADPAGRVVMRALQICGWLLVAVATALVNHADLFGLRQVAAFRRGAPYLPPNFVTPGPYQIVRHPLYLGWVLAFWATPEMTAGHLLFAAAMTVYVRIAIGFEERDLVREHGRAYVDYRARTPMLIPFARRQRGR